MDMNRMARRAAGFLYGPIGAKIVVACWLLAIIVLSVAAPGAKLYAVNSGEGSVFDDTPSAVARKWMNEQFPSQEGANALLVFHGKDGLSADQRNKIGELGAWLASEGKPQGVVGSTPYHRMPASAQEKLLSEDKTTLLLSVALGKGLASDEIHDALEQIRNHAEQAGMNGVQFEITGPAGIASDTITMFRNADLVLMFATVGLILVILIVIYRSPLLAVIPLAVSGIVYMVVDRILGLAARSGWFVVDKQALSIMMILLFAVLTDYCLFVLSRYREELKKIGSKYDGMRMAMSQVAEPILFSGATVLVAMLTLFTAVFAPYHHFAPVFTIAMAVIALAGVTLIPAVFALAGRKAFWPFAPKLEEREYRSSGWWTKMGRWSTGKPGWMAGILLLVLIASSVNAGGIRSSFNLMNSFPDGISSKAGFELLKEHYPPGQLAPVTVLLTADKDGVFDASTEKRLSALSDMLASHDGVQSVAQPQGEGRSERAARLQLVLDMNPYDQSALDLLADLRRNSERMLQESGFDPSSFSLHFAGQTAEQLDVRTMNERDMLTIFALVTLFIAVMLVLQSRSVRTAAAMMATMLLSYGATLGLGWAVFHGLMGYEAISYRLPVYTFVFLMALGVDYNIMLVSRIREEARRHVSWKEAVSRAVAVTGGVISSAGVILAATFAVLITQPLQELFLFGMTMAAGILIDTMLVRGMLLPAILVLIGNQNKG